MCAPLAGGGDHPAVAPAGTPGPRRTGGGEVGDVVEHDQPAPVGAAQPVEELQGVPLDLGRRLGRTGQLHGDGRLGVRGEHGERVGGRCPHHHVHPAVGAQRPVGVGGGELALADAAAPGEDLRQHHGLVPGAGLVDLRAHGGSGLEGTGEDRDAADHHRPVRRGGARGFLVDVRPGLDRGADPGVDDLIVDDGLAGGYRCRAVEVRRLVAVAVVAAVPAAAAALAAPVRSLWRCPRLAHDAILRQSS